MLGKMVFLDMDDTSSFYSTKLGVLPEGMYRNRSFAGPSVDPGSVPLHTQDILFDPQTAGGLLLAADPSCAEELLAAFLRAAIFHYQRPFSAQQYLRLSPSSEDLPDPPGAGPPGGRSNATPPWSWRSRPWTAGAGWICSAGGRIWRS